jgi:hypothetical protein
MLPCMLLRQSQQGEKGQIMSKNELIDLSVFNTVAASTEGEWLEFKFGGKPTNVRFKVLGKHSERVRTYETAKTKAMARKSNMAEKRKATLDLLMELIETQDDRSVDDALARVCDWDGVKGQYNDAAMREFLTRNPQFIDEIMEFSDDASVFTKAL